MSLQGILRRTDRRTGAPCMAARGCGRHCHRLRPGPGRGPIVHADAPIFQFNFNFNFNHAAGCAHAGARGPTCSRTHPCRRPRLIPDAALRLGRAGSGGGCPLASAQRPGGSAPGSRRAHVEVLGPAPEPINFNPAVGPVEGLVGLKVGVGYRLRVWDIPGRPEAEALSGHRGGGPPSPAGGHGSPQVSDPGPLW